MDDFLFEKAIELHEKGDFKGALDSFTSAAHKHPLASYLYGISLREGWSGVKSLEREKDGYKAIKASALEIIGDLNKLRIRKSEDSVLTSTTTTEKPYVLPLPTVIRNSRKNPDRLLRAVLDIKIPEGSFAPQDENAVNYLKSILPLPILETGYCYLYGWGVRKDETRALNLIDIAARMGDPDAQIFMGNAYEKGVNGVKKNKKEAARYFQQLNKSEIGPGYTWIEKEKYTVEKTENLNDPAVFDELLAIASKELEKPDNVHSNASCCIIQ